MQTHIVFRVSVNQYEGAHFSVTAVISPASFYCLTPLPEYLGVRIGAPLISGLMEAMAGGRNSPNSAARGGGGNNKNGRPVYMVVTDDSTLYPTASASFHVKASLQESNPKRVAHLRPSAAPGALFIEFQRSRGIQIREGIVVGRHRLCRRNIKRES